MNTLLGYEHLAWVMNTLLGYHHLGGQVVSVAELKSLNLSQTEGFGLKPCYHQLLFVEESFLIGCGYSTLVNLKF